MPKKKSKRKQETIYTMIDVSMCAWRWGTQAKMPVLILGADSLRLTACVKSVKRAVLSQWPASQGNCNI